MTKNEYYGFDEDFEIYCASIYSDACNKKKAAEEAAKREEAHGDAVDLIAAKINNFFRYFEDRDVMPYVDEAAAAKQILLSLTEDGHVSHELLLDAAYELENNIYCNDGVPMRMPPKFDAIKRKHIVTKLIQYLENRRIKNPELDPLPVPAAVHRTCFVEFNN